MTTGATPEIVDTDTTQILSMHWEKAPEFEPRPGAVTEVEWVLLSWGPSQAADCLAAALRENDPHTMIRRVDVATESADGVGHVVGVNQRHVFFADETVPLAGSALTGDGSWAWAYAVLHAAQRVVPVPGARLWIVTRTGLHGSGAPGVVRPEHDFAWALGRCHAAEHPDSWGGLVDLDVDDPASAGRMLAGYLLSGSPEDEVLLRDGGPLVARLRVSALPPTASGHGLSPNRLHIISGGAAGLSFEIEQWLARQGARRLLILGRSPLDGEREGNLRRLNDLGCAAEYEILDVGDPAAVHALTQRLRERGDAVGAVFHLASDWRLDGRSCVSSLAAATDAQTRVLIGAKATGALLLGELAEELAAEAMVLFSSAAATLGSPGQANYAAVNAVLDGVARRLHSGRVRAVSIAWGPIRGVGFGATREGAQLHDVWEKLGLRRLSVTDVLTTVEMALSQDEPNLTVMAGDDAQAGLLPWAGSRPALESLAAAIPTGSSLRELNALDDDQRVGYIVEVIRTRMAQIIGCPPERVDPEQSFTLMGVDSLIALEVLFVVEREFAVRLGLDHLLLGESTNLVEMAKHLDQRIREVSLEVAR